MAKSKIPSQQAPAWLYDAVYEPKRKRTLELVTLTVDALVEQRARDGKTRISLNSITALARQLDPAKKGVAHTAILENAEAYAYYKRNRTASKPAKQQQPQEERASDAELVIKGDRDLSRVRQRYIKLSKAALLERLLSVEQQYVHLQERWLRTNDNVLEWQLRAEQAEAQLKRMSQG